MGPWQNQRPLQSDFLSCGTVTKSLPLFIIRKVGMYLCQNLQKESLVSGYADFILLISCS